MGERGRIGQPHRVGEVFLGQARAPPARQSLRQSPGVGRRAGKSTCVVWPELRPIAPRETRIRPDEPVSVKRQHCAVEGCTAVAFWKRYTWLKFEWYGNTETQRHRGT